MIYVPKVVHTIFSLAYPLNLFSPEKSLGHRQHPSTLSYLELAFLVDTTCISPLYLCEKVLFHRYNPRVIHIDSLYHHRGSLWTVVCDEGCSLVFYWSVPLWVSVECLPGDGSFRFPSCVVNPSPSSYIRC